MPAADPGPVDVLLAGATGALGGRIARALRRRGATVRAAVRHGTTLARVAPLDAIGVGIVRVDPDDPAAMRAACAGAGCVVSALNGLRGTIVGTQSVLLDAAVAAGVPRFIPSDYSLDFTRTAPGGNRNLDLRRDFHAILDRAPIRATSILNGAFADLLTGPAPLILWRVRRVLHWGDPDQALDFTTMDDAASYTASAALDPLAPRLLRIAGETTSARGLAASASEATGDRFRPLRAGGIGGLDGLIRITRALAPGRDAVFPPWQGMQYMRDMFGGDGRLVPLDNDRYPGLAWTPVRDVIAARARPG